MHIEHATCRPPHLALVTANPLRIGGMQTFSRFLVDAVCASGWQVTVALSGEDIFSNIQGALDVQAVDWVDANFAGDRRYHLRTAALAGVPVVITHRTMPWIRDFVPVGRHFLGMLPGLGLHNRRQVLKTRLVACLADRIVYNSRFVREEYENVYRYPRRKGIVIVNAAPSFERRLERRPPRDHVTIGCLGRLADEKRLDVLIRAVASMKHRQAVRLLIYGDGPLRELLAELAGRLGIADRVEFRGNTPDVAAAYAELDIVVVCSRRESSSNTALEAMAAGKAVVVSGAGGLPELIDHGRSGECVPIGDVGVLAETLDRLTGDADRRSLLGEKAQLAARQRHDAARISRQWLNLLGEVAARRTGRQSTLPGRSEIEAVASAG